MARKRFYRWVPKHAVDMVFQHKLISHTNSATWLFDMDKPYRPGPGVYANCYLITYDLDATATRSIEEVDHFDFEDPDFAGESGHPDKIILKKNEPGAYGLGKTRQHRTNFHVTQVGYATKREVAKALGINEASVDDGKFRPGNTWPKA